MRVADMGMFDAFDNPNDAAYLALAAGLLGGKGSFNSILGNSLMGAQGAYQNTAEAKRRGKLAELQASQLQMALEQAKQQQQQQAKLDQFRNNIPLPGVGPDGMGPSTAGPNELLMHEAMRAGALNPLDYIRAQQKDNTPIKLGSGDKLLKPGTYETLAENPKEDAGSPLAKLVSEMSKLPPGSPMLPIYQAAIQKASTHQPSVNVSYGAPVAGQDEKGNSVFFQPSKDGKAPPAIVQGVRPAPQNRDTKLPAELQRMQIAGDAMGSLLNDYEALLKKHNPRDPMVQANPAIRGDMQALKRNLELQLKEFQALGALNGPDVEIIRQALSDPFSWQGAYFGRDGLLGQVAQARRLLQVRKDAVLKSQGKPDQPASVEDNDPLGLRK